MLNVKRCILATYRVYLPTPNGYCYVKLKAENVVDMSIKAPTEKLKEPLPYPGRGFMVMRHLPM